MVFRHIFELKWVERELNRVCALYQRTTGLASRRSRMRRASLGGGGSGGAPGGGDALAASLAASYSTCQLMTHFFRQYLMYVTFEVMEPLWGAFEAKVQTASSLDEVRSALLFCCTRALLLLLLRCCWWGSMLAVDGAACCICSCCIQGWRMLQQLSLLFSQPVYIRREFTANLPSSATPCCPAARRLWSSTRPSCVA